MHALHDCVFATGNWLRLLPASCVNAFFEPEDTDWVFENLNMKGMAHQGHNWQSTFMVTAWFHWQWRNRSIFEEGFQRPNNEVEVILKFVEEITRNANLAQANYCADIALVKWKQSEEGWIKLNSDGACKGDDSQARCGGLFRDSTGNWLYGFTKRLGTCNALHAEMWGMWTGIQMAGQ